MTGGGILGVSPGELWRVSSSIGSLADELAVQLQSIDNEVSGFVRSGWTGLSSGAFAESFWKWHEGAKDVHTGLAEMATLLGSAAGQYEDQDQSSVASLSAQMNIDR
ncbi:WXG100 family type VII secretion target [Mycobacterium sp. MAA66]|uniref:WXG100 family type VII secretion target n=1 Tax=Mycobacterium sp. MAA66 TaxID=3156297 RepID=UPI00351917D0